MLPNPGNVNSARNSLRRVKWQVFIASLILTVRADGCLWVDDVDLLGNKSTVGHEVIRFTRRNLMKEVETPEFWRNYAADKTNRLRPDSSVEFRSNYGAALVHIGEFAKARDVLLDAERLFPGNYAVAANLGTTYELLGDNEQALEWIQKGIHRNPESHGGTEWVHVRILEAKIASAKDSTWLQKNSILGLDFGGEATPKTPNSSDPKLQDLHQIIHAIGIQLQERLQFVKAPDPFVGDLLFDLANALAVSRAAKGAADMYSFAQEYHAPRSTLLTSRLELMQALVKSAEARQTRNRLLLYGGSTAAAVAGLGVIFRAVRRRRMHANDSTRRFHQ